MSRIEYLSLFFCFVLQHSSMNIVQKAIANIIQQHAHYLKRSQCWTKLFHQSKYGAVVALEFGEAQQWLLHVADYYFKSILFRLLLLYLIVCIFAFSRFAWTQSLISFGCWSTFGGHLPFIS